MDPLSQGTPVSPKVIYVSIMRLSDRVISHWFIEYLIEHGVNVEYWDMVDAVGLGHGEATEVTRPYVRRFRTLGEFDAALAAPANRGAMYMMLITYTGQFTNVYSLLSKHGARVASLTWGVLPVSPLPVWRKILQRVTSPVWMAMTAYYIFRARLFRRLGRVQPPAVHFAAGRVALASDPEAGRRVAINSVDYDAYRRTLARPGRIVDGRYAVFLDINLPFQTDLDLARLRPVQPGPYFTTLNRFFGVVENAFGVRVVIAAHPKANYGEQQFEGREIHRGLTAELVRDAEFVLTHTSTAQSYAVLNRKPLLFVYTDEMRTLYRDNLMREMANYARYLGAGMVNADSARDASDVRFQPVDEERYLRYTYDFLTSRESEHEETRDIILRELHATSPALAQEERPRLHFHTDLAWFAGCETMLVNLLSSSVLREEFDVSLSFRDSPRYRAGLQQRIAIDFPIYPLDFRDPSGLFSKHGDSRAPLSRIGRAISRPLTTIPLLVLEVITLRRLFRRIRPDILHVNNGGYPGALSARAAVIAARLAGVPHVVMVLNNLAEGYDRPSRWLEIGLDRAVAACTELFMAGSRASVERIRHVLRLPEQKTRAVANGADLRRPTETVAETRARVGLQGFDGVVFGIVALMEPRKGHRVLLDALALVVREQHVGHDKLRLLLLGDGPLRAELEARVRELGLHEHCRFLGQESNGLNVISALDALVLSSIANEDFPNVILEAMGAGKPVIASRLAGTPEQVADGETGLLVPCGDVNALAAAISLLLQDADRRAAMGAAGARRYAELFTARAAVDRYVERYRSLLVSRR